MKLKGQTVRIGKKEYTLRDQLGQGGFSTIYETNHPDIICKVQVLISKEMIRAYTKEKQILKAFSHPNIVKLYDSYELDTKEHKYGMLFMEKCSNGTAFNILQKNQGGFVNEKVVVKILYIVADVLELLHSKGVAHRDIKMENVLLNAKGQYKLCDFGSCSTSIIKNVDASNRVDIEEYIEKTTTPLYRSPQQLDLYSGMEIGLKVDIFALGVLAFMMCFQKPPFQSRLSAINKQYFIPDTHNYSKQIVKFIEKCFTTNPQLRPSASELKQQLRQLLNIKRIQIGFNLNLQFYQTIKDISMVTQGTLKKNVQVAEAGIIDKIKRIYNQMTTQTEGWIAGFAQDNEEAPMLKYNRSIIQKCYEKKYKIQKVYELLEKYSEEYKFKCLVTVKLLILIHNFLRKGPQQAITYEKDNSPLHICTKLYKLWKTGMVAVDQDDFKRNTFVCLLIRSYSLILIQKIKLCFQNSHLIQANYSIVPYLSKLKESTILKIGFITSMLQFLNSCLDFHEQVQRIQYLEQIQKTIVLSMIDEEYCLVSTLTFIISAFKMAVCYVKEQLDFVSLQKNVQQIQKQFESLYKRLSKLLSVAQRQQLLVENSKIALSPEVISYIRNIKIQKRTGKFNITDHLNYKNTIFGLKIPLAYEEVVKSPDFLKDLQKIEENSKLIVQVNQFKVKKIPLKEVEKQQHQKKSHTLQPKSEKKTSSNGSHNPPKQKQKVRAQRTEKQNQETAKATSTTFSKPKNSKDKIFQNFSFEDKKPTVVKEQYATTSNNLMQFTHQNLNKDFFSINTVVKQEKHDQFNDFFSIVEKKYQKEKQTRKYPNEEPAIISNASKEVFLSENKPDINKIELMNFFFDDDEPAKVEKKEQKQQEKTNEERKEQENRKKSMISNKSEKSSPNLIQFEDKLRKDQKSIDKSQNNMQTDDLIILGPSQPDSTMVNVKQSQTIVQTPLKPKQQKSFRISPSKHQNLIDLKQFVVQQVRKNAEQYIIDYSALIFKEKIGYGNSSEVFKGQWRGRQVAIKKIKDNISRSEKQFKRQIMTSVKIRHHPQLVTLIGVTEHQKYFYIINEYCNGSTLFDLLHESDSKLPWATRINIAKQMARGMIFLHTNDPPIIHRDLKSLNVLLVNQYDQNNSDLVQIKIADFGLSRDYASTYMTGTLGTYHWMAPQIFNNEPYTLKADVYSYGIVLWQIASRVPPYTNMKNPHSLMKFVTMQNGRPDLSFIDKDCPFQWRMLMTRCWDKFPSNRPSFSEILACLEYLSQ